MASQNNNQNPPNPYQIGTWQNQGTAQSPLPAANPYQIQVPQVPTVPVMPPAVPFVNPASQVPNPYQIGTQAPAPVQAQQVRPERPAGQSSSPEQETEARPGWLAGTWNVGVDPERSGDLNRVDAQDVLPNIREILRPLTQQAYEERGGATTSEERLEALRELGTSLGRLVVGGRTVDALSPGQQHTPLLGTFQDIGGAIEGARTLWRTFGNSGGPIGAAIAGVPESVMQGFNAAIGPFRNSIGFWDAYLTNEEIREHIRELRESGNREELKDYLRDLYRSGRYTFNDLLKPNDETDNNRVLQALERMQAGENPVDVMGEIDYDLNTREILAGIAGEMIADPLNYLSYGSDVRRITRLQESYQNRFVAETLDEAQAIEEATRGTFRSTHEIAEGGGGLIDRVTDALRADRTPETRVSLQMDEMSGVISSAISSIPPSARQILTRNGITASPELLVMELLLDPASQNIAGSGRTADQVRDLLGLGRYQLPDGRMADIFRSDAAARTRNVLRNMDVIDDGGVPIFEQWRNIASAEQDALRITRNTERLAAIDAVDEQWARLFDKFDSALRTATGYTEPSGVGAGIRQAKKLNNALQGTMATLQMTLSPGWFTRNVGQNNVVALADGVRTLTPQTDLARWVADNEFNLPVRQMGAGADTLQSKSLIKSLIDKIPIRKWNEWAEQNMSMRIVQKGIKDVMNYYWTAGKQLDPDSVARLYARVGREVADDFLATVLQTYGPKAYDALANSPISNKLITTIDETLLHKAIDLNIWGDVRRILETTPDPDEIIKQLNALQADMFRMSSEAGNSPPIGDWTELAMTAEDELMEVLGDAIESGLVNARKSDFQTTLTLQRAAISNSLEIVEDAFQRLRASDNVLPSVLDDIELRIAQSSQRAKMIQGVNIREIVDGWRELLRRKDIEKLSAMPGFRNLSTAGRQSVVLNRFYTQYNYLSDALYKTGTQDIVSKRLDLFNEINALIDAGKPSKEYDDFVRLLTGGVQLPEAKNSELMTQFMPIWEGAGFKSSSHFRNWLVKNGLAEEAVEARQGFSAVDIQGRDWVSRVIDKLMASTKHKMNDAAQQAALNLKMWAETNSYVFTPDVENLMAPVREMIESVTPGLYAGLEDTASAADMLSHGSRVAAQANGVIDDIISHVETNGHLLARETPDLTQHAQAFNEFLKANRQRLIDARTVAQQVGNALRDAILFNYSDRRNFDMALGLVYAYPFWYTRNLASWTVRAVENPAALSSLVRFRKMLRQINKDLPEYWQDQLSFETAGGRTFIPVLSTFDPLNSFFGDKFMDADQRSTPLGTVVNEMGQYGSSVAAWLQFTMAVSAWKKGNMDEALSWAGFLSQATKGIRSGSTLIRNLPGMDRLIPAGGWIIEPWLKDENGVSVGDKWDRRRVGYALYTMVDNQEITYEQAIDAAYTREGEIYERAVQRMSESIATSVLMSWLLGAGLRSRPMSEVDIARMDQERRVLYANRSSMSEEEYRQGQIDIRERYPWADLVTLFRQDPGQRDETLAWSVINRLPPNSSVYLEAVGIPQEYLDTFYSEGLEALPERARADFMNSIRQLSASLMAPDTATSQEWNDASAAYRAMRTLLETEYGADITDIQDVYFNIRDTEGSEAAAEYLRTHPQLQLYWDDKDRQIRNSPLLMSYYGSFNLMERLLWDDFYNQMEIQYPGIEATIDEYYRLRDINPDMSYDFLDAHPEIGAYWDEKNKWQLVIADQLSHTADTIDLLSPAIVRLRSDFETQTTGEQTLADLINSGPGGLERWQLPEDMDNETLNAALRLEISAIPQGKYGTMLRYLGQNGDLDDTLNAFRTFGNIETVRANRMELLALLIEMQNYRLSQGWGLPGEAPPSPDLQRAAASMTSSGYGGRGSSKKKSSVTYGSSSNKPISDDGTIGNILNSLKRQSPTFWGWLRNLADMTDEQMAAWLKDPAHAGLVSWLKLARDNYNLDLKALLDYFRNKKHLAPETTKKSSNYTYKPSTRFSSPYL